MSAGGSQSSQDSKQRIDPLQKSFLRDLWTQAQALTQQNQPGDAVAASQQAVGGALPYMATGANAFAGLATGQTAGQQQLAQNMTGASPWLGQQIADFGQDIGQNLSQNILPTLRSGGVAAGGPGGSRQKIAAGLAAQGAQEEFAQGATAMRGADLLRQQQAAVDLTRSMGAGAAGAVQSAPGLYGMQMNPYMSQWLPLQQYAQLIQPPVVTGRSESDSVGFDFSFM